jgi:AcrR family transcriptional regulator
MPTALSRKLRTRGADHDDAPQQPPAKRRVGHPTVYEERVTIATAAAIARRGATDEEIAEELGIATRTLYAWYRDYPELSQAVREAKEAQDDRVERSFFRRATGYTHKVEKVFANGKRITVDEHVPGDPGAQLNWLKNRRRKDWRDTKEIDLVVPVDAQAEDDVDIRQLALGVINLLNEAATLPPEQQAPTLDLEPHSTEEPEDGEPSEDTEVDDFDPDFDDPDV